MFVVPHPTPSVMVLNRKQLHSHKATLMPAMPWTQTPLDIPLAASPCPRKDQRPGEPRNSLLLPFPAPRVIAEPGRYFVEASHVLFTRIYAKRKVAVKLAWKSTRNVGDVLKDNLGMLDEQPAELRRRTAYYINEGVHGCFKDSILCGVQFEPCSLKLGSSLGNLEPMGLTEGRGVGNSTQGEREEGLVCRDSSLEEEECLVMGPSGRSEDIVASGKMLPPLECGDWLYFTRMGAYTTSIASKALSSASDAPFCYIRGSARGSGTGVDSGYENSFVNQAL
ncbi:unnamed protein product [Choristocarpus tenellus]